MKKFLLILIIIALFLGTLGAISANADVKTTEPAPNFSLPDTRGKMQSLVDFKGKYVVLEWVNFDCPFVKKHYDSNNMQSLQNEMVEKGVVWLSINSSAEGKQGHFTPEEVQERIKQKGAAPTAYLFDSKGEVGRLYGAKTTPHMFIINPEGVLIYQGAIDNTPSTDTEDIAGAKNYVRTALAEAMAGQAVVDSTTQSYGCSVKY